MKQDTVSQADLAREFGISQPAVHKALRRAGLKAGAGGLYNRAKALSALAVGAAMDKNHAKRELTKAATSGIDPADVRYRTLEQTLRRITVQCEILEDERDKARGELIPRETYRLALVSVVNLTLNVIDLWISNISAKRADAELMGELRKCRDAALARIYEQVGNEIELQEAKVTNDSQPNKHPA